MSELILEGWVEGGHVRLREEAALPDKAKVSVVVPGAEEQVPRNGALAWQTRRKSACSR